MTFQDPLVAASDEVHVSEEHDLKEAFELPAWVDQCKGQWGSLLVVDEWQEDSNFRVKEGWKGKDLVHDPRSPVRVLEYYVKYGPGVPDSSLQSGGVGTTLTGITHFTRRAESHKGFCHGGSMCSLLDDVIGWVAFLVTGKCRPWTGYTVQVNSTLKRPIPVDSILLVQAEIVALERRKVSVRAVIRDPAQVEEASPDGVVHAIGEGLVILNRGVLNGH